MREEIQPSSPKHMIGEGNHSPRNSLLVARQETGNTASSISHPKHPLREWKDGLLYLHLDR